jgi:hypothetical protein
LTKHPHTLVEISGRDSDDLPELPPESGAEFESRLVKRQDDDLVG